MSFSLQFRASAEKELKRLPDPVLVRVDAALLKLAENPYACAIKKLKNHPGYRMRAGDYRILFEISSKEGIISISAIRHRREAYRKK